MLGELLRVSPDEYQSSGDGPDEAIILGWLDLAGAYWGWEGPPSSKKPHAELTSGLCSNGYIDCPRLLSHPKITEILGRELGRRIRETVGGNVDWVVSSAYAAITIGHEAAKFLEARFANVEKDPSDPRQKRMLWRRLTIPAGARVLQVEELITTWGTTEEVRRAVQEGNSEPVEFLSEIGTFVFRPQVLPLPGERPIALLEREIWAVEQSDCPLCQAGSPRVSPKTHWEELVGS